MATRMSPCDTCEHHEETISKVSFMWGGGWVITGVLALAITIIITVFTVAFGQIDEVRKESETVKNVVMETNVNLKHLMTNLGIEYQEPSHGE